jgi:ribosomal protein L11 methyltransferase
VPSAWLQLSIRAAPAAHDVIANFLMERGSPGVVLKSRAVQAYFPAPNTGELVEEVRLFLRRLEAMDADVHEKDLRWRIIKDRNWNTAWRRFFRPQRVGRHFLVCPPWEVPAVPAGRHLITIEPGLAFGTGTHASTRGCMELLEHSAASLRAHRFDALDVGTGSGILSIALVKLGAAKVWAIDNDPVALKVARVNIAANGVAKSVRVSSAALGRIRGVFSIVVANLTAPTIVALADKLAVKVAPGGFLILAGILTGQARAVVEAFADGRFKVLRRKREKEWMALLLRRH